MPLVPIGSTFSTVDTGRAQFECQRCGCRAVAEVDGIGSGRRGVLDDGGAREAAQLDAMRDVERTIRCVRCPECRLRNPGAVLLFWKPTIIILAVFAVIGFLVGIWMRGGVWLWAMPLGFTASMSVIVFVELPKWRTIDERVHWIEEVGAEADP